jgi:AcrR family transcriptional regulator
MTSAQPAKRPAAKRPGGRTARNREAVREAVAELIGAGGTGRISGADVAARSGVHLATIYRNWGSIDRLVLDVAMERLAATSEVAPTGSLRGDLLAYAHRVATATDGTTGFAFLHAVVMACGLEHDRTNVATAHLARHGEKIQEMLDRDSVARERVSLDAVLDKIVAPIYVRVLFGIGGITDTYVTRLVDELLATARQGPRDLDRIPSPDHDRAAGRPATPHRRSAGDTAPQDGQTTPHRRTARRPDAGPLTP